MLSYYVLYGGFPPSLTPYIYERLIQHIYALLFGIACLANHTALNEGMCQSLYTDFIVMTSYEQRPHWRHKLAHSVTTKIASWLLVQAIALLSKSMQSFTRSMFPARRGAKENIRLKITVIT